VWLNTGMVTKIRRYGPTAVFASRRAGHRKSFSFTNTT
jgi:hypothetical protein